LNVSSSRSRISQNIVRSSGSPAQESLISCVTPGATHSGIYPSVNDEHPRDRGGIHSLRKRRAAGDPLGPDRRKCDDISLAIRFIQEALSGEIAKITRQPSRAALSFQRTLRRNLRRTAPVDLHDPHVQVPVEEDGQIPHGECNADNDSQNPVRTTQSGMVRQ
jgi:hypothetical protein